MNLEHEDIKILLIKLMRLQEEINEQLRAVIDLQRKINEEESDLKGKMLIEKQLVENIAQRTYELLERLR